MGWASRGGILALLAAGCSAAPEGDLAEVPEVVELPVARLAARRLTRAEYDRTVRDLLGTARAPGRNFPVDDATSGFDTVADGLVVSPLLVELWERTAALLVSEALEVPLAAPVDVRVEAEDPSVTSTSTWGGVSAVGRTLGSSGAVQARVGVPEAGRYRVSARVWGDQGGDELVAVSLGVAFVGVPEAFDVAAANYAEADTLEVELDLLAGPATLELAFLNDAYVAGELDRNVHVDWLRLEGPLDFVARTNEQRARLVTCDLDAADPAPCVRTIVGDFARRAWRRPVAPDELEALMALAEGVLDAGDPADWALEFALRAVLTSPHFTFLVEPEVSPGDPIDDHALASRLSYLLWSSMPDDRLFELADAGTLHDPAVLEAEVDRMIADPKADGFVEDLSGQWLMVRALDDASPDFYAFPAFTADTRASMKRSMTLFFADLLRERRPLTDLVDSPYVFVDNELRLLLGLPDLGLGRDGAYARIDLGTHGRRGWLTQPGLLTATSYPTRTSPVKRGVWVVSNLLCDEPLPPPPGVEGFPEPEGELVTVRDRLEAHRADPVCNSCHEAFDPVGLAFENFDGIGRWRDLDQGVPVDATGQLPDGTAIDGVASLAAVMAEDERLLDCVVEKVFTYAHRRAPVGEDAPFLAELREGTTARGGTLRDLLVALVTSETFRAPGGVVVREVAP